MKQPETFEEAVDFVCERINPDTVNSPGFHFSGGMQMRNGLGLWNKDSPLHKHMLERFGLCHADDTGMIISHAADAKKNNKPYSPDEDVKLCKNHWLNVGLDPSTMKEIGKESNDMLLKVTRKDRGIHIDNIKLD